MRGGYPRLKVTQELYPENNMDGRQIVISKSKDISKIDNHIMNDLCNGKHIYILKTNHINTCEDKNGLFYKLSNNNDDLFRLIFITENLKQEFKIMEYTYFSSEERMIHRAPFPRPPFDNFYWKCPVCTVEFDNM